MSAGRPDRLPFRVPHFAAVAARLARHEPGRLNGLRLALRTLQLWAGSRLGRTGTRRLVRVTAPNGALVTLGVWTYIDMLVVVEVFLDDEYRPPPGLDPATILDLGANSGVSVAYFRALYPRARIVAVEPDPRAFRRLRRNAANLPNVVTIEAAAAEEAGTAEFFVGRDSWYSSLFEPGGVASTRVAVRAATVDGLLEEAGVSPPVDLLKLDIEGGEWQLLIRGDLQRAARVVVGELHGGSPDDDVPAWARRAFADWELELRERQGRLLPFTAVRPSGWEPPAGGYAPERGRQ